MAGSGRYMTPNQAQVQGFGGFFTIAENYTKFSMMFPNQEWEHVDAVSSPFPVSHDGGILHHVWISGCYHALHTIDGSAKQLKQEMLTGALKQLEVSRDTLT